MPIADAPQFAFKYVNGHPNNTHRGLLTVLAFGVLADVATGAPRLLSELTITTDSRRRALIGNGAQSEFQALAFRDLVGITELRLFDVDPAVTAKLVANLAGHGLVLRRCDSADIVTTVTADKTHATIVAPDRVAPGMHFNAVGGDCPGETDLRRGVLKAASMFVEFEPQTRIEGDLQQMPADFAVTELWRVLAGLAPGRRTADLGIGAAIKLVPWAHNPKALFGVPHSANGSNGAAAAVPGRPVAAALT